MIPRLTSSVPTGCVNQYHYQITEFMIIVASTLYVSNSNEQTNDVIGSNELKQLKED